MNLHGHLNFRFRIRIIILCIHIFHLCMILITYDIGSSFVRRGLAQYASRDDRFERAERHNREFRLARPSRECAVLRCDSAKGSLWRPFITSKHGNELNNIKQRDCATLRQIPTILRDPGWCCLTSKPGRKQQK